MKGRYNGCRMTTGAVIPRVRSIASWAWRTESLTANEKARGQTSGFLSNRQRVWNEVRPHQALNYLTLQEYLVRLQTTILPTRDVIVLQT